MPFPYLFYLITLFFTEGLWKPASTELLTLKLPSVHPPCNHSESCIKAIPFIFCGVGQWITLLCLFSSIHFPIASHFAGATEALKRQLAFRRQNIEKVRAVWHNAAIHGAHQPLKCPCIFLMTKATEHNRERTSIITCFQELAGFDLLHKSWDRKGHQTLSNMDSWASNTYRWLLCFASQYLLAISITDWLDSLLSLNFAGRNVSPHTC